MTVVTRESVDLLPAANPQPRDAAGFAIGAVEQALLTRIGQERFELWFEDKTIWRTRGSTLHVDAGNAFAANWIRTKFSADLQAAAALVAGHPVDVLVAVGAAPLPGARPEPAPATSACLAAPALATSRLPEPAGKTALNARHTLEEFVVVPSNQLAYHAARQVAADPGAAYSPLFLHGHCGLGKTHLLQAICQQFSTLHPAKRWLYLTGEQFTNDFLEGLRHNKMEQFRRRIRSAELLVIDDVHFLAHKKATQEEFLHTFNQIDAKGRQVVLASDCEPKQIAALAESLVSRFVSGMVLRIDAPDLATRLEILRRKVARNHWQVSAAVLAHIAQTCTASIREMEGMLLQVMAGMRLPATVGAPAEAAALAGIAQRSARGKGPLPVDRIIACVAEHFGLGPSLLLGSSREKAASTARAVAMYLARHHTGMSFPEIGRAIGNKNHSTVIAACQRVEHLLAGGELVCWQARGETRHQVMADLLHELEVAISRPR